MAYGLCIFLLALCVQSQPLHCCVYVFGACRDPIPSVPFLSIGLARPHVSGRLVKQANPSSSHQQENSHPPLPTRSAPSPLRSSHVWCRSWSGPCGSFQEPGAACCPVSYFALLMGEEGGRGREEGGTMTARPRLLACMLALLCSCVHTTTAGVVLIKKGTVRCLVYCRKSSEADPILLLPPSLLSNTQTHDGRRRRTPPPPRLRGPVQQGLCWHPCGRWRVGGRGSHYRILEVPEQEAGMCVRRPDGGEVDLHPPSPPLSHFFISSDSHILSLYFCFFSLSQGFTK